MTHPNKLELKFDSATWMAFGGAEPFDLTNDATRLRRKVGGVRRRGGEAEGPFFADAPHMDLGVGAQGQRFVGAVVSLSGGAFSLNETIVGIDAMTEDGRETIAGNLSLGREMRPETAKKVVEALVRANATRAELEAIGFEFVVM